MTSPSVLARKRSRPEDWGDADPSPVIHIRNLPRHSLEKDLVTTFQPFGHIRDVTMMPQKNQALVEYEDIASAEKVVLRSDDIKVLNQVVQASFSTSKHIVQRAANRMPPEEQSTLTTDNHVLLFTIYNIDRPITVDVIHRITCSYGRVCRIVIFRKLQVQAMIEFASVAEARNAKLHLNGADIYPASCTLKVDYARPTRLTVNRNDQDNWDFEKPDGTSVFPNSETNLRAAAHHNSLLTNMDGLQTFPSHAQFDYSNGHIQTINHFRDQGAMSQGLIRTDVTVDKDHNWLPTPVVMLYNLDVNNMNCDRVFNLLCLYGNVVRVKFLKTKEGSAMVEMADVDSALRVISNLNGIPMMDKQLVIRTSKQKSLSEVPHPYALPDGTPSFKDFTHCRNNRYSTVAMAQKNRIYPPSRVLHYWNAPPNVSAEELGAIIVKCGASLPQHINPFSKNSSTSSSGTIQWNTDNNAFTALALCNHNEINDAERSFPFIMKLAFANPSLHKPGSEQKPIIANSNGAV